MNCKTYTVNQGKVRIDLRKHSKFRLRFNNVHEDQLQLIQLALESARAETDTEYDTSALTNICMHYLAFQ